MRRLAQSGIATLEQATHKELTVGGTGPAADTDQFPKVLNATLGTRFKIVTGYPGGNEIDLAMERGEVAGRCGWSWSSVVATHKHWVDDRKINILVQLSLSRHAGPVECSADHGLRQERGAKADFQAGVRAAADGQAVPGGSRYPGRARAALRKAFMDTLHDKEFLAEAARMKLEINPVPGEAVQSIVQEVYQTPKQITAKAAEMINR